MIEQARTQMRRWQRAWEARQRGQLKVPVTAERSPRPTVYFLTPDQNTPSGGVRVIYRHVDALNAGGIPAFVLHQRPGFACNWFQHHTRVTDVRHTRVGRGDLLVLTEPDGDLMVTLPRGTRHAVFNQSGHLTWKRACEQVTQHCLHRQDLVGMVTVSTHSTALLRHAFPHLPIHRVHLGIDPAVFHPAGAWPRPRRIGYMPRRGQADAQLVLNILRARGQLQGWEVVPLSGLSHEAVADHLRTLRIFLSFPYQEGFGLPAAEAMACGAYVVGFHGYGGREYLHPEVSAPIDPGDVLGFAQAVEHAVRQDTADDRWCQTRGLLAAQSIQRAYAPARETQEVCRLYARMLEGPQIDQRDSNAVESVYPPRGSRTVTVVPR